MRGSWLSCESAWGPDADTHGKPLKFLGRAGSIDGTGLQSLGTTSLALCLICPLVRGYALLNAGQVGAGHQKSRRDAGEDVWYASKSCGRKYPCEIGSQQLSRSNSWLAPPAASGMLCIPIVRSQRSYSRIVALFQPRRNFNGFYGWGTWIRTKTDGVRVRCSTVKLFPSSGASDGSLRGGDLAGAGNS